MHEARSRLVTNQSASRSSAVQKPARGRRARVREEAQGSAETAPDEELEGLKLAVGSRLRGLRTAQAVSLRALAKRVGLTSGFISHIENGRVMPSVAALVRICAALDADVGDVLSDSVARGRVVRKADRAVYRWESGVRDEVVSADATKRLELLHSRIAPGGGTGEPFTHGSEIEVALVLKGQLQVTVGEEQYELEAGDALTFSGSTAHSISNPGPAEAEVVWALTPATF